MGSRLIDRESAEPIWDLRRVMGGLPWRRRSALKSLAVSDSERDGKSGEFSLTVLSVSLSGFPSWADSSLTAI